MSSGAPVSAPASGRPAWWEAAAVGMLLATLEFQLLASSRRLSQTFDEADHILAGLRYWRCSDYAANSEHPPAVKLLATLPLVFDSARTVPFTLCDGAVPNKRRDYLDGRAFLYANDADGILFETRLLASVLTLALALLLYVAVRSRAGPGAGLISLWIFAFEPNVLAQGALVTTDMGLAFALFASVLAFDRCLLGPNPRNLGLAGLSLGLALAVKHSAVLALPILVALALAHVLAAGMGWRAVRAAFGAFAVATAIGVVVLWGFYGFRFAARPGPPTLPVSALWLFGRWHLLPEAYLEGFADVMGGSLGARRGYLLGRLYEGGCWYYFPLALAIKTSLALLLLAPVGLLRTAARARVLFALPPALLLLFSLPSHTNIGVRHVLGAYPFLSALAGIGAWNLVVSGRVFPWLISGLLGFQAASSLRSFPDYLAYANEAWGGTRATHRLLTDSNVDWGQGLKLAREYLDRRGGPSCAYAYFGPVDPAYYGIRCLHLPDAPALSSVRAPDPVPSTLQGVLLIGATEWSGVRWAPPNPYAPLKDSEPTTILGGSVLVFEGTFDLPLVAAASHAQRAAELLGQDRLDEALVEARESVRLGGGVALNHFALARVLERVGDRAGAALEIHEGNLLAAQGAAPHKP